jgi:hypothetical protein
VATFNRLTVEGDSSHILILFLCVGITEGLARYCPNVTDPGTRYPWPAHVLTIDNIQPRCVSRSSGINIEATNRETHWHKTKIHHHRNKSLFYTTRAV